MEIGGWDSVPNWDVRGGAPGESPHAWIIKEGTAASREANKMMWYGQWESVQREGGWWDYRLPEGSAIHGP